MLKLNMLDISIRFNTRLQLRRQWEGPRGIPLRLTTERTRPMAGRGGAERRRQRWQS
jgi:hypothetical protein